MSGRLGTRGPGRAANGGGSLPAAVAWLALLLGGTAATLSLIEAGPSVGYQHLAPRSRLLEGGRGAALVFLAMQGLLVAVALWRRRVQIARLLTGLGGSPRGWLLALTLFVASSAALSRSPTGYVRELALLALLQLVHLTTAGLVAANATDRMALAAERWLGGRGRALGRWIWSLVLGTVAVSVVLTVSSYGRHPHVPDEVAYLMQARTYAAGQLALAAPPVPEAFDVYLLWARGGRWFSPFPPAWPGLLALGSSAGLFWLVNPLLAGLNVWLVGRLAGALVAPRAARIATVLFAVAPWNLFLAMSYMAHTSTLTVALIAALAITRLRTEGALRWAALSGAAVGAVTLFRPLEGAILGLLLGFWSLGVRGRRWRLAPALAFAAAAAIVAGANLPYNARMTGSARSFPVMEYMNETFGAGSNDLGFGANRGAGWTGVDPLPGHGVADAGINAALNLFQINVDLFGWPSGSLVLLCLAVVAGRWRREAGWMWLTIAAVVGVHSLYWFSGGPDFGARYWYLAIVPLVLLSAIGLESLGDAAALWSKAGREKAVVGVLALTLAGLCVFVPWRAVDKYHHYRGMRPDLRQLTADPVWSNALVVVRGAQHPDYASAAVYNPLDWQAEGVPLFAWDRGRSVRERLLRVFPERAVWIVDGPTITGDGYRVVAGPLSGDELLAFPEASTR